MFKIYYQLHLTKLPSHLVLPERFFLIFRLKKQQHLVSSTTSTSLLTAIGALDLSAVSPSTSPLDRSIFVDPRTTWTEGWRFSLVNLGPRPSIPLGFDSDQAPKSTLTLVRFFIYGGVKTRRNILIIPQYKVYSDKIFWFYW